MPNDSSLTPETAPTASALGPQLAAVTASDSLRFPPFDFRGEVWDLAHLESFAIPVTGIIDGHSVDVVVLFSCHCFTRSPDDGEKILPDEIYTHEGENRVLCPVRYKLSKAYLPALIKELPIRKIQIAGVSRQNFFTFELHGAGNDSGLYTVFFEVGRMDKRRVVLRVQSAYILNALTQRQRDAKKVRFEVLIRAAYEGRTIRG